VLLLLFFSPTVLEPVFDSVFSPLSSAHLGGVRECTELAKQFDNSQAVFTVQSYTAERRSEMSKRGPGHA
jgi:hypothetical protein